MHGLSIQMFGRDSIAPTYIGYNQPEDGKQNIKHWALQGDLENVLNAVGISSGLIYRQGFRQVQLMVNLGIKMG